MAKKKTVEFAGENIVISHIVSVKSYESAYKCYVEVKTATREYIEEFDDVGYSLTNAQVNASLSLFHGTPNFKEHFGDLTIEEIETREKEFEEAKKRLHKKTIERQNEILNLL
ncbi:hypothetical protein EOL94_01855 [bacterium]|nr:hypothetical protein [bacterium]